MDENLLISRVKTRAIARSMLTQFWFSSSRRHGPSLHNDSITVCIQFAIPMDLIFPEVWFVPEGRTPCESIIGHCSVNIELY